MVTGIVEIPGPVGFMMRRIGSNGMIRIRRGIKYSGCESETVITHIRDRP